MLTLKWEIINRSRADGRGSVCPSGNLEVLLKLSSETVGRHCQTCALPARPRGGVKSIASEAGTIDLGGRGVRLDCHLSTAPAHGWNPAVSRVPGEAAAPCLPSSCRSIAVLCAIHGSKRRWDKQRVNRCAELTAGFFQDCVRRSLKLFCLVGKQTPLMIFCSVA